MYYFINVLTDLMLFILGIEALEEHALFCVNHTYLVVDGEFGGLYMMFHTLTILMYSFIMFHIFYRLPKQYGMVSYSKIG